MDPVDRPLYSLPARSHGARRAALVKGGVFCLLDVGIGLLLASQDVARTWHYLPELGRPILVLQSYPEPRLLLLAGVLLVGAVLLARVQWGRQPALLWSPPLLALLTAAALRPLYSPVAFLRWSVRFERLLPLQPALHHGLAVFVASLSLLVLLTMTSLMLELRDLPESGDTHGSSHWATLRELRGTGLLDKPKHKQPYVTVGAWRRGRRRVLDLRSSRDTHVLLFAPSGSGKTTSLVIPTLLEWSDSVIVLDIKGELWNTTAGYRKEHLRSFCLRFDPSDRTGTAARFNPLLLIPKSQEDVMHAQALADILIDPDGRSESRTFWSQAAWGLLVGVILHVVWSRNEEEEKTLAACTKLLSDPAQPVLKTFDEMRQAVHDPDCTLGWVDPVRREKTSTHPVVAASARAILNMDPRTSSGVIADALSRLEIFRDPIVAHNTSTCDFYPEELLHSTLPVSLYLTASPAQLERLRPLMRMVLNQIFRRLTDHLEFEPATGKPQVRHRLLLLLDEFTTLGRLDFFGRAIAFLRGFGIRAFISVQALVQLFEVYGKDQSITSNCGVTIAYAPNDVTTAELLSRMTGVTTVNWAKRSYSGGGLFGPTRPTYSTAEVGRPLLTSDEVRRLPTDSAVVLLAGHPPIRALRIPYYEQPHLLALTRIAPPEKSDDLHPELKKKKSPSEDPTPPSVPQPPNAELREAREQYSS